MYVFTYKSDFVIVKKKAHRILIILKYSYNFCNTYTNKIKVLVLAFFVSSKILNFVCKYRKTAKDNVQNALKFSPREMVEI